MNLFLKAFIITLFFVVQVPLPSFSQGLNINSLSEVVDSLEKMEKAHAQQKVYLHTDKDEYIAGENIWLKAYLVDATNHLPDTRSNNLSVELVNLKGDMIDVQLLRMKNGFSHSEIELPDSLPEGNYQLRAYTDWMRNFDSDFYFKQELFVHNPIEENFIRLWDRFQNYRFNRRLDKKEEGMEFAFFPKGGNLVQGLNNRVAFKATNALGAGQDIIGRLVDDDGNLISEFETIHNGMGVFSFTPEKGKEYEAEIKFPGGEQKSLDLPDALIEGYILRTDVDDEEINIEIESNFNPNEYGLSTEVYLLAHVRGQPYFTKKANVVEGALKTSIPLENLPEGVCHITLFDANVTPLAERLIFTKGKLVDEAQVDVKEVNINGGKGLSAELFLEEYSNGDNQGSYSLSVIGSDQPIAERSSNIATYFMLTNDLGKTIEDPWFYLADSSEEVKKAMDLVMMTHGWRRFDWEDVFLRDFREIRYDITEGITLRGQVTTPASGRQPGEHEVELNIKDDDKVIESYSTKTDDKGNFIFSELDHEGMFTAEFQVGRDLRRRRLNVDLEPREFDLEGFSKSFSTRPLTNLSQGDNWERVDRPEVFDKTAKPGRPREAGVSKYGTPDQVIYMEDIGGEYNNMLRVLKSHVRGLREEGGVIVLRGETSLVLSNEPLFMVDDVPISKGHFLSLHPNEVERVEVFSGISSSMFGVRGQNGVIIAYQRGADSRDQRIAEYVLKGYSEPSEFYHSKIDVEKNRQANVPKTIFWEPYITFNDEGYNNVEFPMENEWEHLSFIIEGIDQEGNITYKKLDLEK